MTLNESLRGEFGNGMYSIPDISFIIGVPKNKIHYWIKEFWDGKLGERYHHKYSWMEGRDKVTNFLTLVECYVFSQLCTLAIPRKEIFEAHHVMAEQLKTVHPFAKSKLLSDGTNIFFTQDDGTIVSVNPNVKVNHKKMIKSFCNKIKFSKTKNATCFYPMGIDKHVVIHPQHKFGAATIENTNILAEVIASLHEGGESPLFIARLYDLSISEIKAAIRFWKPKIVA